MNIPQQPVQKSPGFACPKCGFFIEMSLEGILYEANHKCPRCTTVFTMDRNASTEALKLIQQLSVAVQNLEATREFKR